MIVSVAEGHTAKPSAVPSTWPSSRLSEDQVVVRVNLYPNSDSHPVTTFACGIIFNLVFLA